ncbi:rab-GTPase-TBC domain-containing protein, partial [Polychytrium aggregatum]|uniref:rab-GTPase-TBC domain-containing protein n=1 Tax=Polychytrium aggregatum TaxID=110093 RepID=UPI0022FF2F0E
DAEIWESILQDYHEQARKYPYMLKTKIRAGIPSHLRRRLWRVMCDADTDHWGSVYNNLLKQEIDPELERIIKVDVQRTFRSAEIFREEEGVGQTRLTNVLKAFSVYDTECGYCQGLNCVVAPLIIEGMSEVEAFSVLIRLMEDIKISSATGRSKFPLRSLFIESLVGLHQILRFHDELVKIRLPVLYEHFERHEIDATKYAQTWFLTLFSYQVPIPFVLRIMDIILSENAFETLLRFSLALLRRNQSLLFELSDMEAIVGVLKTSAIFKSYESNPEEWVEDAMEMTEYVIPYLASQSS